MTCEFSRSDGAYVLGALSPAERTAFEAHLPGCPQCSAAVARLAPMPGLLGRVDPQALSQALSTASSHGRTGPGRLPQLLRTVTAQRRRQARVRRWRLAAVAATAALLGVAVTTAGTGLAGGWSASGESEQPPMVEMEPVVSVVPVGAEVATEPVAGGTEVRMTCWYPPVAYEAPASTFRLVAVGPDGAHEQLGSWRAAPGDEVTLTGMTRFTSGELVRLELHSDTGNPLLARSFS